jgi:hypothetical protein
MGGRGIYTTSEDASYLVVGFAGKSNAALEWQARSLGWRSWALTVACPLEGLDRRATSLEENSSEFSYEAKLCKLRAFCELSIESRDRSNY